MKKTAIIGFMMMCVSSTAMAYGYDYVDEMAYIRPHRESVVLLVLSGEHKGNP